MKNDSLEGRALKIIVKCSYYIFNKLCIRLVYQFVRLMARDVTDMSIDGLFGKLHGLMINLVKDVDSVIEDNKSINMDAVRDLREHISEKLGKKEEIQDNEKLLKLLNLFSEDRAVLEIIREDAEEWTELLEAIEKSITDKGPNLTKEEQAEVKQISKLTSEIKSLIRKEE